jgi:hypothetical protein
MPPVYNHDHRGGNRDPNDVLVGNAKLTIYPESDHDSRTETYDNPELYQWLLQQERGKMEPK